MANGGRIVFVFDDIIERPLGTYGHLGLLKVFWVYLLGLGGLPKRPGYVAIELRRGSSWNLSGKSPGKGSGKGSGERSEHEGKHSQTGTVALENENDGGTVSSTCPALTPTSLSHPSLASIALHQSYPRKRHEPCSGRR
jgi:hypothetical protein